VGRYFTRVFDLLSIELQGGYSIFTGFPHISLSQFCAGGISGRQNVGVFTKDGCRFFTMNSSLPALKVFADTGYEVARGTVQGGIYVQESA
jgi:hypothetical protein